MSLPIRTTLDDVGIICQYLAKKPMGATAAEARTVLDSKYLDGRKLTAFRFWGFVDETPEGRMKITEDGRTAIKGPSERTATLRKVIGRIDPYRAIVERAHHRREGFISAVDVAAHWHQHFKDEVSENEKILNDQAVCFFQIADGAGIGNLVIGRKGSPTRFEFAEAGVRSFIDNEPVASATTTPRIDSSSEMRLATDAEAVRVLSEAATPPPAPASPVEEALGQAIFIAHGKNKKPLEQLKKILDQFKIPYKVAVDEPNLGRPIGAKVQEIMRNCNCAILIFTADEEFQDAQGKTVWRPSENVVYELGATGFLYGSRIVIMKEDAVLFPTNFRDLGYITFAKDELEAKAMDVLKELIGFGIVKVST